MAAKEGRCAKFLSTPSGWRATRACRGGCMRAKDFYPRPPGGGRPHADARPKSAINFYPRPPGGGRRCSWYHSRTDSDFYPRPPGGGRHFTPANFDPILKFLSTPSGWRATNVMYMSSASSLKFLSTPSGWRATIQFRQPSSNSVYFYPRPPGGGRHGQQNTLVTCNQFLSTPSGWRATPTMW